MSTVTEEIPVKSSLTFSLLNPDEAAPVELAEAPLVDVQPMTSQSDAIAEARARMTATAAVVEARTEVREAAPSKPEEIEHGGFVIRKAKRSRSKLRAYLSSPSGGGKTYSALLLAFGFTGRQAPVVVIDTEQDSASKYEHLGDFYSLVLQAPFSPSRYIAAIKAAEKVAGPDGVIIIDSTSHLWNGPGGCLEIVDALKKGAKNQWTDTWGKVTPEFNRFVQTMLQSTSHIIATARQVSERVIGEDKKPKKVGVKDVQREGFEFEFDLMLEMSQDHYATVTKNRTTAPMLVAELPFVPGEDLGIELRKWADSGSGPAATPSEFLSSGAPSQNQTATKGEAPPSDRDVVLADLFKIFKRTLETKDPIVIAGALRQTTKLHLDEEYGSFQDMSTRDASKLLNTLQSGGEIYT